jgi:hypothetical protein
MKRFVAAALPLLLALACAPRAFSIDTETTTANAFLCDVVFHAEDGKDIALDGDVYKTLNYRDRTFVPLRAFAELLGAEADFAPAGADGQNLIDVGVAGKAPAAMPEKGDAEGYISLYDLQYDIETSDSGEAFLRSGMLRVNKDLDGREITLWLEALEEGGTDTMIENPIVLNEAIDPLRAGDTRPFIVGGNFPQGPAFRAETPPFAYGPDSVASNLPSHPLSFQFHLIGYAGLKSVPDISFGGAWPTTSLPSEEEGEDGFWPSRIHRLGYAVASTAEGRLTTEAFNVGLQFYSTVFDGDGGRHPGKPVLYKELKFGELAFDGTMLFRDSLLWDGLGDDGAPLPEGDYMLDIVFPNEIRYSIDGGPVQATQFGRSIASGTSGLTFLIRNFDATPYGNGDTEVLLAPTRVRFLFDDVRLEVSVRPDGILYLDNRTYIPLRLFAESMGATVSWTPPADTGTGRGRVDIFSPR